MRVLGTAGHVDHGKSTLVRALTGIDPDRLREEKERQMTIDLGFAWMSLPDGESVGIVDVPGHRDFIENMLAGVGGIDAALMVVAADEGVMPQTREHLAILDLLEIPRAVIALTKVDLVTEEDWLGLVEEEVRGLLAGTRYAQAPVLHVSAETGEGLEALIAAISTVLKESPPRPDKARPRLPIDRSFTIAGFGTVVTGTLMDGALETGQEVEILPGGIGARVRGLQTHKKKVQRAVPGSRLAANLSGVDARQVVRGDVVVLPGTYEATRLIDVRFRMLAEADKPLRHNQEAKLFVGSAQRMVRVRVLGVEQILPGQEGWLQLAMRQPVVVARGDHFILRRPSPGATLGGGRVADPHPRRRHRRFDGATLQRLEQLLQGTAAEVLAQALIQAGASPIRKVVASASLEMERAREALQTLKEQGDLIVLGEGGLDPTADTLVIHRVSWERLLEKTHHALQAYHTEHPIRSGMPREELKSRLGLDGRIFSAFMERAVEQGELLGRGHRVAHPAHKINLTSKQRAKIDRLMARFGANPFSPPTLKECREMIGDELVAHLVETGKLVPVSAEVVFTAEAYGEMVRRIRETLETRGTVTVAEARDLFGTSRKYVLPMLEHLDAIGETVRDGDLRRLAKGRKGAEGG